eukprot:scaffold11724_cov124-Isochrysis_galbana.AAC.14
MFLLSGKRPRTLRVARAGKHAVARYYRAASRRESTSCTSLVGAFASFSLAYASSGQLAHTHTAAHPVSKLAFALPTPWAPRPRQLHSHSPQLHHRALCGEGPGRAALYMGSVCARLMRCCGRRRGVERSGMRAGASALAAADCVAGCGWWLRSAVAGSECGAEDPFAICAMCAAAGADAGATARLW